jgi:hypothetical protein
VGIISQQKRHWFKKNILCSLKISLKHGEELLFLPGSYLYSELCPIVAGIVTMDKKEVHVLQCD